MNFQLNSSSRYLSSSNPAKKNKKRPPLTLEQLEARMLMAIDVLEQQIDEVSSSGLFASSSPTPTVSSPSVQTGNRIQLLSAGNVVTSGQRITSAASQFQLQLLRDANGTLPNLNWSITSTDPLARGDAQQSGAVVTLNFSRPVDYRITAASGATTLRFNVRITPSLTTLVVAAGSTRLTETPLTVTTNQTTLTVTGLDEVSKSIKLPSAISWQVVQGPQSASPNFQVTGTRTKIVFDRAGQYVLRVSVGNVTRLVNLNVAQTFRSVAVTPSTSTVNAGQTLQLTATALDQFQQPMATQPSFTWTATGGTISNEGLYQAGSRAGTFRVSVRTGTVTARTAINIVANNNDNNNNNGGGGNGTGVSGITDSALRSLVTTYYADSTISRDEMIGIINTAGSNSLTATELADLRYIVSTTSTLRMAEFVRTLAKNVVTSNAANLNYRGQAAGNLVAGSSSTLVGNLVDKWFKGTDVPVLTSNSYTYRNATGSLFPTAPQLSDSQQGMLGDCYFLAALVAIGSKNADAIRNMFIENSDGTVTVRFYANGVADYVTVNRSLPTMSNGALIYSGYGRSATGSSTPLWLALAEKAYVQWNETGKTGRGGADANQNTYTSIEGGWMGDVNAQALGYSSTNFAVNSTNKQNLINSLNSGLAVTIGTTQGASAGGLVGSHAYVVTSYNATTDAFSFFNPWNTSHPSALTWNQMQGQTSFFVVTSPSGSGFNGARVSGSIAAATLETYVETAKAPLAAATRANELSSQDSPSELASVDPLGNVEFDPVDAIAYDVVDLFYSQSEDADEYQSPELTALLAELAELSIGV
jgi:hypothetical protein